MNRMKIPGVIAVLAVMIVAGWAWGGLEGSKHDFSNEAWSDGDLCAACHAPHRDTAPKAAPLWDPNADLDRTFGTLGDEDAAPGSGTLMCLRCHDGTIARDTLGGAKRERFTNKQHTALSTASHDRTDHPVSVRYPDLKKGYRPVTSVISVGTVPLPDGFVECISCHDPHNSSGADHMLVMSNERSALCLTCHRK